MERYKVVTLHFLYLQVHFYYCPLNITNLFQLVEI